MLFEARMIVKYDTFVGDMQQVQGRHQSLGQKQSQEPVRPVAHSYDSVPTTEENVHDLDAKFQITIKSRVEKLEWAIKHDLEFKFHILEVINAISP